jgi:hypothetical protein
MRAHLLVAESHYGEDIDEPMDDMLRRWASQVPRASDILGETEPFLNRGEDANGL